MKKIMVEYIWIDGNQPTAKLRSKTKVVSKEINSPSDLPDWSLMVLVQCRLKVISAIAY